MKQLLACLVLLSLTFSTFADDCNNPLLTTLGLSTGKYNNPTAVTGLKYCSTLQASGTACCSADTINSIQDKTAALATKISGYVAARDQSLTNVRENVLPGLQAQFQQFKDALAKVTASMSGGDAFSQQMLSIMTSAFQGIINSSEAVYNNLATYKSNYNQFQKYRTTCMTELLKLQASAYCLACDPTWASRGVSGSTVIMSDKVCGRVQSACYNYIQASSFQNSMLYVQVLGQQIAALTSNMANPSGVSIDMSATATQFAGLSTDKLLAALPSEMPSQCTGPDNCKWACDNLMSNGVLSETLAVIGGAQYTSSKRLLEEDEVTVAGQNLRRLATGTWDPEQNEAGVTVAFNDDPGNTAVKDNAGSMLKVGVVCAMGMIALLF